MSRWRDEYERMRANRHDSSEAGRLSWRNGSGNVRTAGSEEDKEEEEEEEGEEDEGGSEEGEEDDGGDEEGSAENDELDPLEDVISSNLQQIEALVAAGWQRDEAEGVIVILETIPERISECLDQAIALLRDGKPHRDGEASLAASTYLLCNALFAAAKRQQQRLGDALPPALYMNLGVELEDEEAVDEEERQASMGLLDDDPYWKNLDTPDQNGFAGLTSTAPVGEAYCSPLNFTEEGYSARYYDVSGGEYLPMQGPVVRFDSGPADEQGMHAAIMLTEERGTFPPNTLFRLKQVLQPGFWEAPGGLYPKQKLYVVTATYRNPSLALPGSDTFTGKLCESAVQLSYGDRDAFVKGIADMTAAPTLTIEQEFERDHEWKDWKGVEYTLKQEWEYVNGPASQKDATPGSRDANNVGMTPEDFLERANQHISNRRQCFSDAGMIMLPEKHAFLTKEDVLAVRLYSGPAYQPINTFLRAVSQLKGAFRDRVAKDPALTFAATVGHLCRAIRKLAAYVHTLSHALARPRTPSHALARARSYPGV